MSYDDQTPAPAEDEFQAGPVGGIYDGQRPSAALYVAPVGVQTVRQVASLLGSSGTITADGTGVDGQVFPVVSTDPHRRAITIGGVAGTPRISHSRDIARTGGGVPVPTGATPTRIQYCGELFVWFPLKTDSIGFFCEIDPS